MKKLLIGLLCALPLVVDAKSLHIAGQDYLIHGGASGTFQYHSHSASNIDAMGTALNDLIVGLASQDKEALLSIDAAIGNLQQQDFFYTTAPSPPMDLGVLYGWFNLHPIKNLHFELGLIETRSSYESTISFQNPHVTMGATRRTQANYYTGFRLNAELPELPVRAYAEFSAPDNVSETQLSAGLDWRHGQHHISVNYSNAGEDRRTINSHANARLFSLLSIGYNIDYHTKPNFPDNLNAHAFGIAGYLALHMGAISIPFRAEVIDDGDTNIYGLGRTYSITVSPTKKFSEHVTARLDGFYVQSSTKPFKDERGFVNSQIGATLQLVWHF